jgi:hypothetical protein
MSAFGEGHDEGAGEVHPRTDEYTIEHQQKYNRIEGEGDPTLTRSLTTISTTQKYGDCFVYAGVAVLLKIIEYVIKNRSKSSFGSAVDLITNDEVLRALLSTRVAAPLMFKYNVNVVEVVKLDDELKPWGHLWNVLQKYIRKYYSSNGGDTIILLSEFFEKLNELSREYNAASDVASYPSKKKKIITDFLAFQDEVCEKTIKTQESTAWGSAELNRLLTDKLTSLVNITTEKRAPEDYIRQINSISKFLNKFMKEMTEQNQLELNRSINHVANQLKQFNKEQTGLITFLEELKKNVNLALRFSFQCRETNDPVTLLERDAVVPLFESLLSNLQGNHLEINSKNEDKVIDLDFFEFRLQQIYSLKCKHARGAGSSNASQGSAQDIYHDSLVDSSQDTQIDVVEDMDEPYVHASSDGNADMTDCFNNMEECQKLMQLYKRLSLGIYASFSMIQSKAWFNEFEKIPDNIVPGPPNNDGLFICRSSSDKNLVAKPTIIDNLHSLATEEPYGSLPGSSLDEHDGHEVVVKGMRIIGDEVYLFIENSWGGKWPACWINIKAFGAFSATGVKQFLDNTPFYSIVIPSVVRGDNRSAAASMSSASGSNRCYDSMDTGFMGNECDAVSGGRERGGQWFLPGLSAGASYASSAQSNGSNWQAIGGGSTRKTRRKPTFTTRKLHTRKQRKTKNLLKNKKRSKTVKNVKTNPRTQKNQNKKNKNKNKIKNKNVSRKIRIRKTRKIRIRKRV